MRTLLVLLLSATFLGCGSASSDAESPAAPADPSGLTTSQLEHGVGPISSFQLEPMDPEMAARGQELFQVKCSACHKMDERYVGPPLGEVAAQRSPAFVMNMILNPEEMIQKHPDVKELLAEFLSFMPNQHLTEDEARAVLEFLRSNIE